MGKYIETKERHNKADQLIAHHGAIDMGKPEYCTGDRVSVAVVVNLAFEAACLVHNRTQFAICQDAGNRPVRWLSMSREEVIKMHPDYAELLTPLEVPAT